MPFDCCRDEQPQVALDYYGLNQAKLSEMFERRNKDLLRTQFGGTAGLAETIQSDLKAGIPAKTEADRIRECGLNALERRAPARLLNFIIQGFMDRTIQILSVAAVVSIILGMTVPNAHTGVVNLHEGWIEGVAIIVSVAIVVSVSSINNYIKAKKFEEMENNQTVKELQVLRDGAKATVLSTNLVVGDVLYLTYGMELSVDALVITAEDLKINESAITGEPILIRKSPDADPFLISGTSVEEGAGTALVVAVGMSSFQGRTKAAIDNADKKKKTKDSSPTAAAVVAVPGDAASDASGIPAPPAAAAASNETTEEDVDDEEGDATPLQRKLNALAKYIGYFGLSFALLLFVGLVIKEVILIKTQGKEAKATHFVNFVLIGIVLIVVAIPEGLPLAVTIGLAYAMKAMMADHCLVRILAACETMGAATTVCSDKTGTLTTNQMTCVQGVVGGQEFMIDGYGLKPRHDAVALLERSDFKLPGVAEGVVTELSKALSLNSTAGEQLVDGKRVMRGNPTEKGLLTLVDLLEPGFYARARDYYKGRLRHFPFNSTKKRMTTIVLEDDGTQKVYLKGDPEALMAACDRLVGPDGQVVEFTTEMRATMAEIQKDMAKQGNRTLGVAFTVTSNLSLTTEEEPEVSYVLLGVLGIMDPPRAEVPLAVKQCKSSGLIVRMVTGDSIYTAKSIASKCGIYEDNGYDMAMLGVDFCRMYNEEREHLRKLLPRLRVLARSSPTDKYCLVEMLKEDGEVVAVTGDGTNDAPALKLAHVGFAMQTGTDIAKGAADMVLLDDNFATVVTAIKWGRTVNDNVKKFLQFQMPINVTGVVFTLFGALYSKSSKEPFTPVQLLWLNLIMNPLAALAIATEKPEESALDRSPEFKAAPIVTRRMLSFIGCHGLYQFVMLVLLLVLGQRWFDIVENPAVCSRVWPLVDDGTGELVMNPTQEMCIRQCEYHGGAIGPGNRCQQGDTHSTMLFNTFALMQVFNVINARKVHGELNPLEGLWTRSRMLVLIFALIAGLQAVVVQFGGTFISTVPLSGKLWGACIGIAAGEIIIGILQRFIPITDYVPADVIARRARDEKVYFAATGRHLDGSVPVEVPAEPEQKRSRSALVRRPAAAAATAGLTVELSPELPPTALKAPSTVFHPVSASHSPPASLPTSPLGSPQGAPAAAAPAQPKRSRSALVKKKRPAPTSEPFH